MEQLDEASLNLDDPTTFESAAGILGSIGRKPITGNFAVAIAALLHRPDSGRAQSLSGPGGATTSTAVLQSICNDTWRKEDAFLPPGAEGPIYKPFTMNFKPENNNNWRNSFDLQTGLGCNAPPTTAFLGSPEFIAEARYYCQFRDSSTAICHSPNAKNKETACFITNKRITEATPPGPHGSRAALRPKLLGRSKDSGFWLIDQTAESLVGLLNNVDARIPILPFAVSLFAGNPYLGTTGVRDGLPTALKEDLGLDDEAFSALFDSNAEHPANMMMASSEPSSAHPLPAHPLATPGVSVALGSSTSNSGLPKPKPFEPLDPVLMRVAAGGVSDPAQRADLLERASQGHQRTLNLLHQVLTSASYTCESQSGGFDLVARHSSHGVHLFEVKTWTDFNLAKQTRSGWAQLYEYRYRNSTELDSEEVGLYLVFDRAVDANFWAWRWLAEELDVLVCWMNADGDLRTLPDLEGMLPPGVP